jgi:hypothetical protein
VNGLIKFVVGFAVLCVVLNMRVMQLHACNQMIPRSLDEQILSGVLKLGGQLARKVGGRLAGAFTGTITGIQQDATDFVSDQRYQEYVCRYEAAQQERIQVGPKLGPCASVVEVADQIGKIIGVGGIESSQGGRNVCLAGLPFAKLACCAKPVRSAVSRTQAARCALSTQ